MNAQRPIPTSGGKLRPVLIVGAGPTGLMLACELARLDIDFDLIDSRSGPTVESRALVVHARTLERFDVLGIGDAALAEGRIVDELELAVRGRPAAHLSLASTGRQETEHPYLLILEQSRTEALLLATLEGLGHAVRWQTTLVSMATGRPDGRIEASLQTADGRQETVHHDWLVGCDGAGSIVRQLLDLSFAGGTYHQTFFVVDASVDGGLPEAAVMPSLAESSFALFVPMPGPRRYRIVGALPADGDAMRDTVPGAAADSEQAGPVTRDADGRPIRFETIEAALQRQLDVPLAFSDVRWFSLFRVHHRCVERFRRGRCLLAGDSAHVHSPVGGQGMNTGLLDASNLAWKLAMVIEGRVADTLLDSYEDERLPVARSLLRATDRAFRLITERSWAVRHLRLKLLPTLARRLLANPRARRALFRRLSQIGVRYRHSRLVERQPAPIAEAVTVMARGRLAVRSGDRLPYAQVPARGKVTGHAADDGRIALHRYLAAPGFHLLVLDRHRDPGPIAASWAPRLAQTPVGAATLHAFGPGQGADELFDVLRVESGAVLLVRPDQYLGYVSSRLSLQPLLAWVSEALPAPTRD